MSLFRPPAIASLAFLASLLTATAASACACGCAVFDVGTSTLLPNGPGGTLFLEYDYLAQTTNWSGSSSAPSANNDDKHIRSDFLLAGGQYMFNDSWGAMAEVPVTHRSFTTADSGAPETFNHMALGDIRLMGVYSGFSTDMSTGLIFGVKLPTGDNTYRGFDPDVEIGSGSTDLLLGAYHTGALNPDQTWSYFGQVIWQHRIATEHGYLPSAELNAAAGVSYSNWSIGDWGIAPVMQLLVSNRGRDGGIGDPVNTGYTRLLVSPGVAVTKDAWKFYADAEVATFQHVNGNQLIAPVALKVVLSHSL